MIWLWYSQQVSCTTQRGWSLILYFGECVGVSRIHNNGLKLPIQSKSKTTNCCKLPDCLLHNKSEFLRILFFCTSHRHSDIVGDDEYKVIGMRTHARNSFYYHRGYQWERNCLSTPCCTLLYHCTLECVGQFIAVVYLGQI